MHVVVISHKLCWPSAASPSGYATDGGFPFQMQALSTLFDTTTVLAPCAPAGSRTGEVALVGRGLDVRPLPVPSGQGAAAKLAMLPWLLRSAPTIWREMRRADAVHAPIPGNVGTIGMLLAYALRKPLFVRHCGNWLAPRTTAEHFWRWFMERVAGGRNVMLATGGTGEPPSPRNNAVQWIFSTSVSRAELGAVGASRRARPAGHRLIIVCRQEKEKGTGVVIDGLPLVRARFPDATLEVVGDGNALPALKRQAETLGLSGCVTFHGKVDHDAVIRLLQDADVFCYPTTASEGFPKVVLEALACGLPVITTRVSVLPELLRSGGGVLLDAATPSALAAAVCDVLDSPARYDAMSASAVRTAEGFSLERWADTIGAYLTAAWGDLRAHA